MTDPIAPIDPRDATPAERLRTLAASVREASRAAQVLTLEEAWAGTEEEYLQAVATTPVPDCEDIVVFRDHGKLYLFSHQLMTLPYAEAVARTQCDDKRHVIAETVRADSMIYPRPTPLSTFGESPFGLSAEAVTAAIVAFAGDPSYSDIQQTCASDGTPFLFSSLHMTLQHARSLAEWIAVESLQNW